MKINRFLDVVVNANSINELNEIVNKSLASRIRINVCNERNCSFADAVVLKIYANKLVDKENKQEHHIMKKLMLRVANFTESVINCNKNNSSNF